VNADEKPSLASQLRAALNHQRFDELIDTEPPGGGEPRVVAYMPNVDLAVIELDEQGRPREAANVLLSTHYPQGVVVPIDENMSTTAVRWRRWNVDEWNEGLAGSEDILPGRESAPLEYMTARPASVLKLMVGFGVLRLVDRGVIGLDDMLVYAPADTSCGTPGSNTIRTWFDLMITVSDNRATCALIKMLHDLGEMDALNATFRELGLSMLQLTGTNPTTGGVFIHSVMSALDTARLLLIINGSPGTLWHAPDGRPVTADVLSGSSRRFFYRLLAEQGLNIALSTVNWGERQYPAAGIPQRVPERWINPVDGTVTVAGRVFGQDVRPCNAKAEVVFAHKTGWTNVSGGDAGIVTSLPGAPRRHYIVAMLSILGKRFVDPNRPPDPPGVYPVGFTERLALLGREIDSIMTARAAQRR